MCEQDERTVADLVRLGFPEHHAREYVRRKGCCTYCGRDVVHSRLGYATLQWDHLLPRAHYPQFKDDPKNILLACYLCNERKHDYDPSHGQPGMLNDDTAQLIENARAYIGERRRAVDGDWRRVRKIVRGLGGWPDDVR